FPLNIRQPFSAARSILNRKKPTSTHIKNKKTQATPKQTKKTPRKHPKTNNNKVMKPIKHPKKRQKRLNST
ncbi:TPA: hypothetical protein ACSBGX_000170, partial [Shigella sonnei]